MFRKVLFAAVVAGALCSTALGQWFSEGGAKPLARRSVKIVQGAPGGKQAGIAVVTFAPEELLSCGRRDIRIVTKAGGKEVPRIVIKANPSGECSVLFKVQPGVQDYYVYYGNLAAKKPETKWRPQTGILLYEVPAPPGGFPGDTFERIFDEQGKPTVYQREAWKKRKLPAWPRPQALAVRYVGKSVGKPVRGKYALFVFRLEVTASDKPYMVSKLGPGVAVDGVLFIDNEYHTIAGGMQAVPKKLMVLKPGIHTIEAWGGCLRLDAKLNIYVPFTHDFVYKLPEAKTATGKAEYAGGNAAAAYTKFAVQLRETKETDRLYWLYVAGADAMPGGKMPAQWSSFVAKVEKENWAVEWRAYGGGPAHTRPSTTKVVLPLQLVGPASGFSSEPKTQPVLYRRTTLLGDVWGWMGALGRWKAGFSTPVTSTPACISGRVFFGTYDNSVCAVDMATGQVVWQTPTDFYVRSSPAVWRGKVFVGCSDKNLYALSGANGKVLWKFKTGGWIESSPAVADGVVYFGSYDHVFYAVDANTGKERWKFKAGYDLSGSPVIVGNDVIFASDEGKLFCFNRKNGSKRWEMKFDGYAPGMPAVSGAKVYGGTTKGKVYAAAISNGKKIWEASGMGEIEHPLFAAANAVIATSRDGNVYALNLDTGQRLSAFQTRKAGAYQFDYPLGPVVTAESMMVTGSGQGGWSFAGHGTIMWFKVQKK
ncbi:MAG: PQQ-binding-like beta-propeller repeat protein [Planctomycetia bacterium]|nr:PQQ-binding-like beta-propeller repeat protein [Planctomycetia bacterium]